MARSQGKLLLSALILFGGCTASSTQTETACAGGGKCDNTEQESDGVNLPCDRAIQNFSGDGREAATVLDNDDPLARLVFKGTIEAGKFCPLSVADLAEELTEHRCNNEGTAFVSERSQRLGRYTDYRAVTTFNCDGERVILHYPILRRELEAVGITIDDENEALEGTTDRSATELMGDLLDAKFPAIAAEGKTAEGLDVVNFYQGRQQNLRYFGNTIDMLKGTDLAAMRQAFEKFGTSTKLVHGEPEFVHETLNIERNCAACHPAGSLIMKELISPWVHWEPDFRSPMTRALAEDAREIMGTPSNGIEFESTVRDAFAMTNTTRLEHFLAHAQKTGDVGPLLRPLFCAVEFNTRGSMRTPTSAVLNSVVIDPELQIETVPPLDPTAYKELLMTRGSRLGIPEFTETVGELTFIHQGEIDREYVAQLIDRNIIDEEFMADVRLLDPTRAVFSNERCALINTISSATVAPDQINPGGIAKSITPQLLEDPNPAAADLLRNFEHAETAAARVIAMNDFASACEKRPDDEFLADYVEHIAQVRKRAADAQAGLDQGDSSFAQFFFPGVNTFTLPVDDMPFQPGFRLNPVTCEGTTEYVTVPLE